MISTKNVGEGKNSISKTLAPGNKIIKVNKVTLETVPWSENAYNLMFYCEGPDLGESFEGFFINKDDESLGKHKGQVGRVRASRWLFEDKDLGEVKISRDLEIVRFLKHFCNATDCEDWFVNADGKYETIEEFVNQFNIDKPFKDKFINACLCGKEYENKEGYINFDMFFPKFSRNGIPFESENVEEGLSQVYTFNESDHIIRLKKDKEVESFKSNDDSEDWLSEE